MLYAPILLDFAFYAKALPNCFKADILTCSILCAFPSIDSDIIAQNRFRVYSCATVRDFHTIPFSFRRNAEYLSDSIKELFCGCKGTAFNLYQQTCR